MGPAVIGLAVMGSVCSAVTALLSLALPRWDRWAFPRWDRWALSRWDPCIGSVHSLTILLRFNVCLCTVGDAAAGAAGEIMLLVLKKAPFFCIGDLASNKSNRPRLIKLPQRARS